MRPNTMLADRFRLVAPIGSGGMGTVWHATDTTLEREVAVKILRPDLAVDETLRARFRREAQAVAALSTPGIVKIHDAGEGSAADTTVSYLVMELLGGSTLAQLIHTRGPLPVAEALGLVASVAHAVYAAHESHIIHRDIKPANIMVDGSKATIMDFGIAAMAGRTSLTTPGIVFGTASYMAPELSQGVEPSAVTDQYSLGVVLRECLDSQSPAPAAEAVIDRATAQDPGQRYENVAAFANACQHAADSLTPQPSTGSVETVASTPNPPPKRPTTGWMIAAGALAVVILVLLTAITAVVWWPSDSADQSHAAARDAAERIAVQAYSYNSRNFDDTVSSATGYMTEGFREEYQGEMDGVADQLGDAEADVLLEVVNSGVVRSGENCSDGAAEYTDCVTVLLFVEQQRSENGEEASTTDVRFLMTMTEVDNDWKLSALDAS